MPLIVKICSTLPEPSEMYILKAGIFYVNDCKAKPGSPKEKGQKLELRPIVCQGRYEKAAKREGFLHQITLDWNPGSIALGWCDWESCIMSQNLSSSGLW